MLNIVYNQVRIHSAENLMGFEMFPQGVSDTAYQHKPFDSLKPVLQVKVLGSSEPRQNQSF
jgi:hypothetical protein